MATDAMRSRGVIHRARESLVGLIGVALVTRCLTDTGFQIFYPFLPMLAGGLGLSTTRMGQLLGLRNLTGLLSPVFGALADRQGFRKWLRVELMALSAGFLLLALGPSLPIKVFGFILSGIAALAFVPTLQGYLSHRLRYSMRARGIGIVEYGWAFAGIAGLSTAGWIIERTSWEVPFVILGIGLAILSILYYLLPPGHPEGARPRMSNPAAGRRQQLTDLVGSLSVSAWATIACTGFLSFAMFNVLIVFGDWLTQTYDLGAGDMGRVAMAMGIADLCGSIGASAYSDRIGKRRAVMAGGVLAIAAFVLLPILGTSLVGAVGGLMLMRVALEFAIVSMLAFASEQDSHRRGQMMSMMGASNFTASALGGFSGPWSFLRLGITGPSLLAISGMLACIVLNIGFMREPQGRD
ncbi:MAG: MFS transporter [Caldilineaceae bacterium SB0666_bin_21]|nr:MFS transporter [Caldilineaceae bacterium SB0666_bin_21]